MDVREEKGVLRLDELAFLRWAESKTLCVYHTDKF